MKLRSIKLIITAVFLGSAILFYAGPRLSTTVLGSARLGGLAAPTGVSASDRDYANKIGISWNVIRGATTYSILRSQTDNSSSAVQIGTTAANYFFDSTAVAENTYYYWVRAGNGTETSDLSTSDQGKRAFTKVLNNPFQPLEPVPASPGNPVNAAKAALGKALFWDEQMSSTRTVACGTCHRPAEGGSDPRTAVNDDRSRHPGLDGVAGTLDDMFGSPGVPANNADGTLTRDPLFGYKEQVTNRKAPSYLNAGYSQTATFWDGRASATFRDPITNNVLINGGSSLESQSLFPPVSAAEMSHANGNWTQVAARIQAAKPLALATNIPASLAAWIDDRSYPQLFQEVFGTPDVTPSRIALAIATHERMLFSDRTPFDRSAVDIEPLTLAEANGRDLFLSLRCNFCHTGALMTDNQFHNIGVRPVAEDLGRGAITGNTNDRGKFKTPNLRNVELRAPYMHNGRFATLEEVIEFYDRGGDFDSPTVDHGLIRPLGLPAEEKAVLVAFLKRPMTDVRVRDELPPFDRPTLYTESGRMPLISGRGRPGTKKLIPETLAITPPLLGSPMFTIGISGALGGAQATLVIDDQDPGIQIGLPTSGTFAYQTITLSAAGTVTGSGSVNLAIPNDPLLIGRKFYGRWYVRDKYAMGGYAISKMFEFTIF